MNDAKKLILKYPVVDAHYDLLFDILRRREAGNQKVIEHELLDGLKEGGVNILVSAIFVDSQFIPEMALRRALNQISAVYSEIEESSDKIQLCKTARDLDSVIENNKLGILLSFEGVEPLYNDISLLRLFYELGIRILGLVWSRRNYAGDGCHYGEVIEGKQGGLTDFGIQLLGAANKLNMVIDVTHLNDAGFWDVMEHADVPLIASHSNCRSISGINRSLTDKQIEAIAEKDGVIGINVGSIHVSDNENDANVKTLVKHITHIKKISGIEHVGLGLDFFSRTLAYVTPQQLEGIKGKLFEVIDGHKDISLIVDELLTMSYSEEEIAGILGGNFLRVFKTVMA